MDEFDCCRCGMHIVLMIPEIERAYPLCRMCEWLETLADEQRRAYLALNPDYYRQEKNGR